MTPPVTAGQRSGDTVLPLAPTDREKVSYAWRSLTYLTSAIAISAAYIVVAQLLFEIKNPIALLFLPFTLLYLVYQAVSIPVNFTGHSFDLEAHELRVMTWRPAWYPSVDVFLPICGEPLEVLRNTWEGVAELRAAYPGLVRPYVLDDGDSNAAARLAHSFGFGYIRRPVHEYKKAGNLNHGLARTSGAHVVIFDADFRPRADFLAETLPYMDDRTV